MPSKRIVSPHLGLLTVFVVFAQLALAQAPIRSRIVRPVDEANRVTLRGNTHPLARAQNDRGAVADSQPVRRGLLLLQRSPAQEAALRNLLDQQQSASSSGFHQWLTPQQFGQQFGPADADIQTVTGWLESHGLQVNRVSAGRTVIEFSGNVGQIRDAFHTEIHRYVVNGQQRLANASDPQIPAALAPVVAGPVSLNNFPRRPLSYTVGVFRKNQATRQITPLFTFNNSNFCGTTSCNAVGPGDFAAIYNVQKLWTPPAGTAIDGTGQTIAVVGDSEICTANSPDFLVPTSSPTGGCGGADDVATFRTLFGLPANSPNVILDGPDPGLNSDETEGDLDVQWIGAVAKNATIDYVIAEGTEATYGTDLAAEYIVDNNLAPVLSESYGTCEGALGTNGNQYESALWEQAAAQGITVVVAAGDSGSANCDAVDIDNPSPVAAQYGTFVNGIASTLFNVAAGASDFDVTAASYQSTYWSGGNATVDGVKDVSATKYIPETTWNDSCAQNFTGAVNGCTTPPPNPFSVNIVAGGGGQSNCIGVDGNGFCTGWYPKPAWQGGPVVSTAPFAGDGARDLPDVSLFAADGLTSNSFYVVCESDLNPAGATCNLNTSSPFIFDFVGVGGTSSAAPTFAGIMALVNENMAVNHPALPSRQGNANYVLYALANAQVNAGTSCNSTNGPNSACTFNDITKGNNSLPCYGTSRDCGNTANPATYGVLETANSLTGQPSGTLAFNTAANFDLATGLGSINAYNLVNNWAGAVGGFTATSTTLCLSTVQTPPCMPGPISITHGQTVYVNSTVTPSPGTSSATKAEDVALIGTFTAPPGAPGCATCTSSSVSRFTSNNYAVSNQDAFPLTSGQVSEFPTAYLVGGSYTVTAHYTGDGFNGASDSTPPISVTVNPEPSRTNLSVLAYSPVTQSFFSAASTSVPYGYFGLVRADILGSSSGQESATGTVTFTDNGGPIVDPNGNPAGTFTLNTEGYTEDQTPFFAVGAHSVAATYSGDPSYNGSVSSTAVPFTVVPASTTTTLTPSATYIGLNQPITLSAFVDTLSSGTPPTGMVSFCAGSPCTGANLLGTGTVTSTFDSNGYVAAQISVTTPPIAATETITAIFNPTVTNPDYLTSTSPSVTITVTSTQTFAISTVNNSTANAVVIVAPGGSGSSTFTVTSENAFAGTVTLTCSVTPTGGITDEPTCSFPGGNSVVLTANGTQMLTVKLSTTAASSLLRSPHGTKPTSLPLPLGLPLIWVAAAILAALAGLCLPRMPERRRGYAWLVALLLLVTMAAIACGSSAAPSSNAGTTTGFYQVTVSGTSGSTTGTPAVVYFNLQ